MKKVQENLVLAFAYFGILVPVGALIANVYIMITRDIWWFDYIAGPATILTVVLAIHQSSTDKRTIK